MSSDIIISFMYRQMWYKKEQPLLLFFFTLPLYPCMKQIFLTKEDMPLHIRFLKLSVNEVLEVLIGVGTFNSTSIFDTQSLQFVTMKELKKSMPRGL